MAPNLLVSEEHPHTLLTLIVDKKNLFGDKLVANIDRNIPTVLVTAYKPEVTPNTVAVPFHKEVPEIPEGNYSHIFFVWEGKRDTLHILEPLLQKADADDAQFVFITDYHFYSEKLGAYIRQEYPQASIIVTGDVFGNEQYESLISAFFHAAQKEGIIRLRGVGLQFLYPVLYDDLIKGILHVGFGAEKKKLFLGCLQHGMTELSLAHALQKVDPLIKIDFQNEEHKDIAMPTGESLFPQQYPVIRKLQDSYTDHVSAKKDTAFVDRGLPHFAPFVETKNERVKKRQGKRLFWALVVLLALFFSPIFLTLFYGGLGGLLLSASVATGKSGNFSQAVRFAKTGESLFSLSLGANVFADKELTTIFLKPLASSIDQTLATGNTLTLLADDGFSAAQMFSGITRGATFSPEADFLSGVNDIKSAMILLSNTPPVGSIAGINLGDLSQDVSQYSGIIDVLPSLFGFPEKRTYAILFQNNMELRPGGGFIGSFALVTVDKGRIGNITIHDVYDADGQLKGHVEPPYVIRRYIPQVHWYLRDSNFDVDFGQDAKNAAFFLQAETGQTVDGVVGVDLSFVKALLQLTGPVYVPEYKQTASSDNFFLLTESHAEKNSFAGSTQKKDFLTALFNALQNKLTTTHTLSLKAIVPLLAAVKEKHVVFGFSDQVVQDAFTVSGLSSSLWDGRKPSASDLVDFTGINEANIGVNKANAYITRQISQTLAISDEGSVSGKLAITYTNASTPNKWPGGPYKNYLRVVLPLGATLTGISFDNVSQQRVPAVTDSSVYEKSEFIPPQGLEVDSATEEGKQIYGFIVDIPVQKTEVVSVTYTLAQTLDMTQPTMTYDGLLFKQPGVDDYSYTFALTVPPSLSVLQKPSWISSATNMISFTKNFAEDTPFTVTFTKK